MRGVSTSVMREVSGGGRLLSSFSSAQINGNEFRRLPRVGRLCTTRLNLNEVTPANQSFSRLRLISPFLIVLAAVCYYGSYLQFYFNPHDEGGTAAFIAMRLLG